MFLAVKRNGQWMKLTYAEYYNSVIDVAKGFIKVSIMKGNYNVWCCSLQLKYRHCTASEVCRLMKI